MSLPAQLTRDQYYGDGVTTVFTYSFYIPSADSLLVYLKFGNENPVLQIYGTDYTVQNAGNIAGGTITFATPPEAGSGDAQIVTIQRNVPADYEFDFSAPQTITGQNLDAAFLNNVLVEQQNNTNYLNTSIKYSPTDYITQDESPGGVDSTIVPPLGVAQVWVGVAGGGIGAADIETDPDTSVLRSQLANNSPGTDGARLVGYYDVDNNLPTTVHDQLEKNSTRADNLAYHMSVIPTTIGSPYNSVGSILYDGISSLQLADIVSIRAFPYLPSAILINNCGYIYNLSKNAISPFTAGNSGGAYIGAGSPTTTIKVVYLLFESDGYLSATSCDIGVCDEGETPTAPTGYLLGNILGYIVQGAKTYQNDRTINFTSPNSYITTEVVSAAAVALNTSAAATASFNPMFIFTGIAANATVNYCLTLSDCTLGEIGFDLYPASTPITPILPGQYEFDYLPTFTSSSIVAPTISFSETTNQNSTPVQLFITSFGSPAVTVNGSLKYSLKSITIPARIYSS